MEVRRRRITREDERETKEDGGQVGIYGGLSLSFSLFSSSLRWKGVPSGREKVVCITQTKKGRETFGQFGETTTRENAATMSL